MIQLLKHEQTCLTVRDTSREADVSAPEPFLNSPLMRQQHTLIHIYAATCTAAILHGCITLCQ